MLDDSYACSWQHGESWAAAFEASRTLGMEPGTEHNHRSGAGTAGSFPESAGTKLWMSEELCGKCLGTDIPERVLLIGQG